MPTALSPNSIFRHTASENTLHIWNAYTRCNGRQATKQAAGKLHAAQPGSSAPSAKGLGFRAGTWTSSYPLWTVRYDPCSTAHEVYKLTERMSPVRIQGPPNRTNQPLAKTNHATNYRHQNGTTKPCPPRPITPPAAACTACWS